MRNRKVFIDESGDENLNIPGGASPSYVLAAVIVDEARAEEFIARADTLRKRYFQKGEMKSSKVGGNVRRRLAILSYAREELPPFSVVAYRVRKREFAQSSGLKFPKTFVKYFAADLCRYLPASGTADVAFDQKGRHTFRTEFISYLQRKFPSDELFPKKSFRAVDSKACVGVQLADFYAGSIAKLVDNESFDDREKLQKAIIQSCCTWDFPSRRLSGTGGFHDEERHDLAVRAEALERAVSYVEKDQDGEDALLRVEFLKQLIEHAANVGDDFVPARNIEARLSELAERPVTGQALRNRVVGPLRDAGILISSRSSRPHAGYKLPQSVRDIESYIELAEAQIVPSLKRVKSATQIVALATDQEVSLLSNERFTSMRDLTAIV